MLTSFHYIISAVISAIIITSEILFSKYGRTYILILRSPKFLIINAVVYAIFADLFLYFIQCNDFKINELKLAESPFILSVIVGVAIKAIVRINFYTLKTPKLEIHIGLKLISSWFDDFIEKQISDDHDTELLSEIKRVELKLKGISLNNINIALKRCLPTGFNQIKTESYSKEIEQRTQKFDKLQYFILKFGIKRLHLFERGI